MLLTTEDAVDICVEVKENERTLVFVMLDLRLITVESSPMLSTSKDCTLVTNVVSAVISSVTVLRAALLTLVEEALELAMLLALLLTAFNLFLAL